MVMHFSIDDVINILLELKEKNYQSLFESPAFAMLRRVHEKCGAVFSCYCFFESAGGNLGEVPDRYVKEFQENADWLRFGFHGCNADTNYGSLKFAGGIRINDGATAMQHYNSVIRELARITGGGRCIDRFPRIHYYAGTVEDCRAWQNAESGILGLLSAEDDRVCYYHDKEQWSELINKGFCHDKQLELDFFRTCIRLENMKDLNMLQEALNQSGKFDNYLIFTHERFLTEKRIEEYFLSCGQFAGQKGIPMGYFYR